MIYFSASLPNNFTASFGSVVMALSASATSAWRDDDDTRVLAEGANAEALLIRHNELITLTIFMVADYDVVNN